MSTFLLIFFTLYGLINLYFFVKLKSAFSLNINLQIITGLLIIFLIFTSVIIRTSEKQGFESLAISLSWIGYLWMALIFLFLFFGLFIDLLKLLTFLLSKVSNNNFNITNILGLSQNFAKKLYFLLPFGLSCLFLIYGFFEALNIRTEKIVIETNKVNRNFRIVQISDLHIGLLIRENRVRKIADLIKTTDADIVVSTGDLVDGQIDRLNGISNILKEINPPYGKFAVTGNHEFFAGINQALSFTEKAGFKILKNEGIQIKDVNINIVGVDDPTSKRFGIVSERSESALLRNFNKGFIVLLKHRPLVDEHSKGLFDLQLSGHTHKGQIFPFTLITSVYYPNDSGYIKHAEGYHLYISRGTGTWGPPMRIFAPPEITIIDIVKRENIK